MEAPGTLPPAGMVRLAGLRDLRSIVRLYRSQLASGTPTLTPFPFDRVRLTILLAGVLSLQRARPLVRRIHRSWAIGVLVAVPTARARPVGVGFLHELRLRDGRLVGRTGLLVDPSSRRAGWGVRIKLELIRECARRSIPTIQAFVDPRNEASIAVNRHAGMSIRENGPDDPVRPEGRYLITEGDVAAILRRADLGGESDSETEPAGIASRA